MSSIHGYEHLPAVPSRHAEMMPQLSAAQIARKKEIFLSILRETGIVAHAARAARTRRETLYRWRQEDPGFAQLWEEALVMSADRLEDEAVRRGAEGVLTPIYQGGKLVGHRREFSDYMLAFMLKARRPERFRERSSVDINNRGADEFRLEDVDLTRLTEDERTQLRYLLEKAAGVIDVTPA